MSTEELLSDIKSVKKASRRGKMSHVTRIVNSVNDLIANNASRREIQGMKISLKEALSGFKSRHEEYFAILTDDEEIDVATEKLFEIEERANRCLAKVEDYLETLVKSSRFSSSSTIERKSLCSKHSSKESKRQTVNCNISDEQLNAERQLQDMKELHKYEEKLQDLKLQSLRLEMEIRREMQLREAERKLERTFKTHSNIDKGSRGQLVKEESEVISKVEENKQAQQTMEASKTSDKVERQQNNVSINPLLNSTLGLPMVFGRNVIPLTKFDGKRENWTFKIRLLKLWWTLNHMILSSNWQSLNSILRVLQAIVSKVSHFIKTRIL